jgi:hypothetical protein
MLHFDYGYVTCLYVPIHHVGYACSVLFLFDKHMLAFVDLIHALPTRGGKYPIHSSRGSFASRGRKIGKCICLGVLAFMLWELFVA